MTRRVRRSPCPAGRGWRCGSRGSDRRRPAAVLWSSPRPPLRRPIGEATVGSLSRRELSLLLAAGAASFALPSAAQPQPAPPTPETATDPATDAAVDTESTASEHITAPVTING